MRGSRLVFAHCSREAVTYEEMNEQPPNIIMRHFKVMWDDSKELRRKLSRTP
jgi:hypothetical protein